MSIISQAVAHSISEQLTQHLESEKKAIETQASQHVYDIVMKTVPEDVLKCFKKHSSYFKQEHSVRLVGYGFNFKNVRLNQPIPLETSTFSLSDQSEANSITAMLNKAEDKDKEIKGLKQSIYNALISLRSYKLIEANFPEAAKYLPKKEGRMLPTVQLKEVREKLSRTQIK